VWYSLKREIQTIGVGCQSAAQTLVPIYEGPFE